MINNMSTDGMTHDDAVAMLKSSSPLSLQVIQGITIIEVALFLYDLYSSTGSEM